MRTLLPCVLVTLTLYGALTARAQSTTPQRQSAAPRRSANASQDKPASSRASAARGPSRAELTEEERALVEGSRAALIATGLTPSYFDAHFRVARVFDSPGDRRVVWTLSAGGYETTVSDAIGFYQTAGGASAQTHSAAAALGATSDITRTITRARAERSLRRCLGRFRGAHVEYRAGVAGGKASLFLAAERVVRKAQVAGGRGRREERERREKAQARAGAGGGADVIESEGDEGGRAVIRLAAVNLQTGECTLGVASSTP